MGARHETLSLLTAVAETTATLMATAWIPVITLSPKVSASTDASSSAILSASNNYQPGAGTPKTKTTVATLFTSYYYYSSQSTTEYGNSHSHIAPSPSENQNNNVSEKEILEYLQQLQNEEFPSFIPAMGFLLLLAVLGFMGNILVLLVYKSKFHRTPTRIFIMAIAVFDLIANVVCIPSDVFDMFHLWNYPSPVLCRLTRYINASTVITSAGILLALSISRYRKICRPFGKQVSARQAKIMCVGMAIFGWLASIPFGILNGIHTRPTPPRSGTETTDLEPEMGTKMETKIFGYECTVDDAYEDTIWPLVNMGFFLLLFFAMCVPLVVLYTLIGVQACQHSTIHGQPVVNLKSSSTATAAYTLSTDGALINDSNNEQQGGRRDGVLSRMISSKKNKKKYRIATTESETIIDSNDRRQKYVNRREYGAGEDDDNDYGDDEVTGSELGESILMEGRQGTLADSTTREDSSSCSGSSKRVRSLSGPKTNVNFSMVRELTVKLDKIKRSDGSKSSNLDKEGRKQENLEDPTTASLKDTDGAENAITNEDVADDSSTKSNFDDKSTKITSHPKEIETHGKSQPQSYANKNIDLENNSTSVSKKSDPSGDESINNSLQNTESSPNEENSEICKENSARIEPEPESLGLASRLQWIDVTYCLYEDDTASTTSAKDQDNPGTLNKKSTLSRKNSLLQKHRKIREALMEKLKKGRKSMKDEDPDDSDDDDGDDDNYLRNGAAESEDGEQGAKNRRDNKSKSRRNSNFMKTNAGDGLQVNSNNNNKKAGKKSDGAKENSNGEVNQRGAVINRTTAMLILITSVYVLGYIPYLSLMFFRFTQPDNYAAMGDASMATHNLFIRTYYVNSAANAVIYSFCDFRFRKEVYNLFRCKSK